MLRFGENSSVFKKSFRTVFVSLLALLCAIWFRPILEGIPTPRLKSVELHSLNGTLQPENTCQIINEPSRQEMKFCEDVVYWPIAQSAIVSCDPGRPEWNTVIGPLKNPNPRGRLFAYHLNNLSTPANEIPSSDHRIYSLDLDGFPSTQDFHPLGLEIDDSNDHLSRLFVVNHRRDRSVIEIFELKLSQINPGVLPILSIKWRRTLAHDLIWTPNSITVSGPNSLLVSNDHYFNRRISPFFHILETFLHIPGGNVVQVEFEDEVNTVLKDDSALTKEKKFKPGEWNGVKVYKVVDKISFANGLVLTPDGSTLVVASSMTRSLLYYHRLPPTPSVQQLRFSYVGSRLLTFGPDNISLFGPRQLVVAGHPHGLTLLKFKSDLANAKPAGSAVAVISHSIQGPTAGSLSPHQAQVQEIFQDNGEFFASSATALLISTPTSNQPKLKESISPVTLISSGLYHVGLLNCKLL
ncbi:hypothetical protein O181_033200 [Austropuccinia psidii MF-1]|uniref:Arylesterase n=1 Tax=Austropuccinia psidii MF-1 TaxID=1389203 RepID=A0A9Q3D0X3_9BASI|nr:hypothetical protein [Austropuccinia psidii MF-1]